MNNITNIRAMKYYIFCHGTDNFTPAKLYNSEIPADKKDKVSLIRHAMKDERKLTAAMPAYTEKFSCNEQHYYDVISTLARDVAADLHEGDKLFLLDGPTGALGRDRDQLLENLEKQLKQAHADLKASGKLDQPETIEFNLVGFSRGAVSSYVISHMVNQIFGSSVAGNIKVTAIDPVAGPIIKSKYWAREKLSKLPNNVDIEVIAATGETSKCFELCLPSNFVNLVNIGQAKLHKLPGHHATLIGHTGYRPKGIGVFLAKLLRTEKKLTNEEKEQLRHVSEHVLDITRNRLSTSQTFAEPKFNPSNELFCRIRDSRYTTGLPQNFRNSHRRTIQYVGLEKMQPIKTHQHSKLRLYQRIKHKFIFSSQPVSYSRPAKYL